MIPSLSGFRALESPRLRSYLLGQLISLTGTWIQQITIALLAFRITRSSAAVGVALAFSQLPILMLSPLAGVLNDRFDRRRVLVCTQLASLVQALFLMVSYHAGALHITVLFTLTAIGGVISALDLPARQSIVARLVDRPADIRNAVALSSALGPCGAPERTGTRRLAARELGCPRMFRRERPIVRPVLRGAPQAARYGT